MISAGVPGLSRQGSVWIICALRVATELEVRAFEQRVLSARAFEWQRFWTTPPLRPQEAVFEVSRATYDAQRDAIEAWVAKQTELGDVRVVREAAI
jgi:hypothetical protein